MTTRFDTSDRERLIGLAEETIAAGVAGVEPDVDLASWPDWAHRPEATFVTVYTNNSLAGCIGTLTARRPLAQDVAENAFRAAFADPRFPALSSDDLGSMSVHVAVLGPLIAFPVHDEDDLVEKMRVGVDGIVLEAGNRRGTFLPAVWEKLPEPAAFLGHLKRKAGFEPDEWPEDLKVYRFEVEEFDRSDLR